MITGVVRDQAGRPVVYASVSAMRRFKRWNGPYYVASVGSNRDETDDRGEFRLHSLLPGTYVVVVSAAGSVRVDPGPPAGTTYLTTYFPGTTSLSDARTIAVEEQRERSIAITLPVVPVTTVSGIAVRSDGSPAAGYGVALLGTPSAVGPTAASSGITPTAAGSQIARDGKFEVQRVPAGEYTLQVSNLYSQAARGAGEIALRSLEVRDVPIRDVHLMTAPGAIARGRVVWDDGSPQPRLVGKVRAVLVGTGYLQDADIQADGTFELKGLYGRARFEVASGVIRTALAAVRAPTSITAGPYGLNFQPGSVVDDIEVVMTRRVGRFVASVLDETGQPFTTGSVVLLPPSPDNSEIGGRPGSVGLGMIPTPHANTRGEYAIEDVLPGAYLAVAIDIAPYLLNTDTDLMERARAAAVRVQLPPGELRQTLRVVRLRPFVRVEMTDIGVVARR